MLKLIENTMVTWKTPIVVVQVYNLVGVRSGAIEVPNDPNWYLMRKIPSWVILKTIETIRLQIR